MDPKSTKGKSGSFSTPARRAIIAKLARVARPVVIDPALRP